MRRSKLYWIYILGIAFELNFSILWAQNGKNRLELIHADSSRSYINEQKQPVRLLEGNVFLKQDTLLFFCDRAVFKSGENSFFFQGNVKIINGADTILTDSLWYFRKFRKSIARGRTEVRRSGEKMTCHELTYYFKKKLMRAHGDVFLWDSKNYFKAWGNYLINDRILNKSVIYQKAKVVQNPPESDSLTVFGDTLVQLQTPDGRILKAIHDVKIVQAEMIATADSAHFDEKKGKIFLDQKPKIIQQNNEMRGAHIAITLNDKKLKKIIIEKKAEIHSVIDSTNMDENVIKGRKLFLFFENDSIKQMKAVKNAEAKYHSTEEGEKGINYVTADSIKIFMKHNKVDSIFVHGGTEGTYFPENMTEMAP